MKYESKLKSNETKISKLNEEMKSKQEEIN